MTNASVKVPWYNLFCNYEVSVLCDARVVLRVGVTIKQIQKRAFGKCV